MTLKKVISVFLAGLMLVSVFSVGFVGSAAEVSLADKYSNLADALKNDYVTDLGNYKVENTPIDNGINGFDNATNTFAYEHRVTAADNSRGDILTAANGFYLIAEELISTVSGKGCYNGEKLIETVFAYLCENNFTEEELLQYPTVKDVLSYFVGNTLSINSTNWNHRNVFAVKTSVEEYLSTHDVLTPDGSNPLDGIIPIKTAVYQIDYTRTFDSSKTKAYYAFKAPSQRTVFFNYRYKLGLGDTGRTEIAFPEAQASELFIAYSQDTETIPELRRINNLVAPFFAPTEIGAEGLAAPWDTPFTYMSNEELEAVENAEAVISAVDYLTSTYSGDTLRAVYGDDFGNMIVLANALTPTSKVPVRTVRDDVTYTATSEKLSMIADKIDGIFSDENSKAAQSLGQLMPILFPDQASLYAGCYNPDGSVNMQKLFRSSLTKLVFSDKMVNAIIEFVYSTLDLVLYDISDLIAKAQYRVENSSAAQRAMVLQKLNEATGITCYPYMLADYLTVNYPGRYSMNCEILRLAQNNDWQTVNYMAMYWGIDILPLEERAAAFTNVLTNALGGIVQLLIPFMCGDAEFTDTHTGFDSAMYNQYLDKYFLDFTKIFYQGIDAEHGPVELDFKVYLRSQGIYTKLMLPLFRILGIEESTSTQQGSLNGYVSTNAYHEKIFSPGGNYENAVRYIIEPFVYWLNNTYCNNPVNTSLEIIPNLVYLYTRQGPSQAVLTEIQNILKSPVSDSASHGVQTVINGEAVKPFEYVQTFNLGDIINSVYLMLDVIPPTEFDEGVQQEVIDAVQGENLTFTTGSLLEILGENDQFVGLNGLLDKTLPLTYTNEYGETAPYRLPRVQMSKVTATTTLDSNNEMLDPNAAGIINDRWNTIEVMNTGAVFLPTLRYIFSALGYKYSSTATVGEGANATPLPIVKDSMAVDWNRELAPGITLNSVLENAMLRPDDTICALVEMLISNEEGYFYRHDKTPTVKNYTYPLDNIKHHAYAVLDKVYNPTASYGEHLIYSEYWTREYAEETVTSAETLVKNFCTIMGIDAFGDGFGPIIRNALSQGVFNNEMLNTLFSTVYSLLYTETAEMGAAGSLAGLIKILFGTEYTPSQVAQAIDGILGYGSPATAQMRLAPTWQAFIGSGSAQHDWGIGSAEAHGLATQDAFFRIVSGMLVPLSFAARFMLLDEPLEPMGLLEVNSYAGYRYGVIGLLEALSCPDILTHSEYYTKCIKTSETDYVADANVFYYLFAPVSSLIDDICENTVVTLLSIIPNLALFLSTGTANDALNNIMHPLYVLFDIAKPIVNLYDVLGNLIPAININGFEFKISLPFDIDFNKLVADLITRLTETGLVIMGEQFIIPDFDLNNVCAGKLEYFNSREGRRTVRLNSASGGDTLTAVLRILLKIFLIEENKDSLANLLVTLAGTKEDNTPKLDDIDKETIKTLLTELINLVASYKIPDIALFVVYFISANLTSISGTVADALKSRDLTLPQLIEKITSGDTNFNPQEILPKIIDLVKGVIPSPDPVPGEVSPIGSAMSLFERIKEYFMRVYQFFMKLFGFA